MTKGKKIVAVGSDFDFEGIKPRMDWPFKYIEVGETVFIPDTHGKTNVEVQRQCHGYGKAVGKKFTTRVIDGVVYVKRVS